MSENSIPEVSVDNIPLTRENVGHMKIETLDGSGRIHYETGKQNVSHYPYDRIRLDKAFIKGNTLQLAVGLTNAAEAQEDSKFSDLERDHLKVLGKQLYDNQWAYFSRPLGIEAVIISSNGAVILKEKDYVDQAGPYAGLGGFVQLKGQDSSIDQRERILEEAEKSLGVKEEYVRGINFTGVHSNAQTGFADLTYLVRTELPTGHFTKDVFPGIAVLALDNYKEVQELLKTGRVAQRFDRKKFGLSYGAEGVLRSITPSDMEPLS